MAWLDRLVHSTAKKEEIPFAIAASLYRVKWLETSTPYMLLMGLKRRACMESRPVYRKFQFFNFVQCASAKFSV